MKKLLLALLTLGLLTGCTSTISDKTISEEVKNEVEDLNKIAKEIKPNMSKRYYQYYLPTNVGRVVSSNLGEVFKVNNINFTMNLDSNYIINNYYSQSANTSRKSDEPLVSGEYISAKGTKYPYKLYVEEVSEDDRYLYLDCTIVNFETITNSVYVDDLTKAMFKIAMSMDIDMKDILADFSALELIDENKEEDLNEYLEEVPKEGVLAEQIKK